MSQLTLVAEQLFVDGLFVGEGDSEHLVVKVVRFFVV
jgi:hypothetical protein